jgi:hypothetical protein
MNKNIYQSGIIAIPLEKDENFNGNLQPNYMVLHNQGGWFHDVNFVNPETKKIEKKTCTDLQIQFVIRGLWANGELKETIIPDKEFSRKLPVEFLTLVTSYDVLIYKKAIVNAILQLFTFEGGHDLEGFVPKLDLVLAESIGKDIKNRKIINKINSFFYREDADEYLTSIGITLEDLSEYESEIYYDNKSTKNTP